MGSGTVESVQNNDSGEAGGEVSLGRGRGIASRFYQSNLQIAFELTRTVEP